MSTPTSNRIRTNAVRSSATEFDAKVDPADFDDWLRRLHGEAWLDGYNTGKKSQEAQR